MKHTKDDKDRDPLHPEIDSINSKSRSAGECYTKNLKETYGQETDPLVVPFDPLVAIVVAGGRPNGRMEVHIDSVITSSLPRDNTLRAMSMGSTSTIERHVPHTVSIIEKIQGKPMPEMPAMREWNILNPSQGSNNVPLVRPQVGGVGEPNEMTPFDVDVPTEISKTM
ncbi:hypothetical protein D1007_32440 [Hordeum vulgare]|nr:hypothetical protein D1007_32440 [Hordeum vulgare]